METPLIHGNVGKDKGPERMLRSLTIALAVGKEVKFKCNYYGGDHPLCEMLVRLEHTKMHN